MKTFWDWIQQLPMPHKATVALDRVDMNGNQLTGFPVRVDGIEHDSVVQLETKFTIESGEVCEITYMF